MVGFATPIAKQHGLARRICMVNCSGANVDMAAMGTAETRRFALACFGSGRRTRTRHGTGLQFNPDKYAADLDQGQLHRVNEPARRLAARPGQFRRLDRPGDRTTPSPIHRTNYTTLLRIDTEGLVIEEGGTYYVSFNFTLTR